MIKSYYILIFSLLLSFFVSAKEIHVFNPDSVYQGFRLKHIVDSSNSLTISDIQLKDFENGSDNSYSQIPAGFNQWVKIELALDTSEIKSLSILFDQANIDYVEVYQKTAQNRWKVNRGGTKYVFDHRKYKMNHLIFDLQADRLHDTIYVKLNHHVGTSFNTFIGETKNIIHYETTSNLIFTVLIGAILAMSAYNFFLYVSLRDTVYLVYVISSLITGVLQMVLYGFGFQFLWPNQIEWQHYGPELFTLLGSIMGMVFMRLFLKLKENLPIGDKILKYITLLYIILIPVVFINVGFVNQFLLTSQGILALTIFSLALVLVFLNYEPAKYYLLSWSLFLFGIVVFVMAEQGIIPRNNVTTMGITFGSAFEAIMLSFALASSINILKKKQEIAIENSLRLEREKAELVQRQNVELENKVKSRTQALETANLTLEGKNKELNEAYSNLKNTQSQLVHAEKMSSLGQLTAGIAHEINNPINFVSSNIHPLKRDMEDLVNMFTEAEKIAEKKMDKKDYELIAALKERYDFDFIKEEINLLLNGMSEGVNRTVEIIRGLKLFSRVDEDDLKRVNLEEGLDSTLTLLNSSIKHHVKVKKVYGAIPLVECYGGKINQVFMNIISNSIQALNEANTEGAKITITTEKVGQSVRIIIADNGPGIPEEIRERIFEPFFTTKPVGEGTGLGLSIVYKIIENLNGQITVQSEPNKGTEFIITLPIDSSIKE